LIGITIIHGKVISAERDSDKAAALQDFSLSLHCWTTWGIWCST